MGKSVSFTASATPQDNALKDPEAHPQPNPRSSTTDTDAASPTPANHPATATEISTLFAVPDRIPTRVWLVALSAASQRFAWYAATTPLQNYLQHGALHLPQSRASDAASAFIAVAALAPIPGAFVADGWLGRYWTCVAGAGVLLIANIILLVTSLPSVMQHGGHASEAGLAVFLVLFALGDGAFRAAATAFMVDQYTETVPRVKVRKNGERVVTDRELTVRYILNSFYWLVNVLGLLSNGTPFLEHYVGFWAAYIPATVSLALVLAPLLVARRSFVRTPPFGTVLGHASRVLTRATLGGFSLDAARPSSARRATKATPWSDSFVDELGMALRACRILAFFPIHWLCLNQTFNNLIAQAGQMETAGVPNDAIKAANPLSAAILYPLVQRALYPALRRAGVRFGSGRRITLGFVLLALAMAYAAGLQRGIYAASPCYDAPGHCAAGSGPNHISVFLQLPVYVLGAAAEIFCLTDATEHAYHQAPPAMRSVVQAMQLSTSGIGSLLALAFNPLAKDPLIVIMYAVLAGLMGATALLFWLCYRRLDSTEMERE